METIVRFQTKDGVGVVDLLFDTSIRRGFCLYSSFMEASKEMGFGTPFFDCEGADYLFKEFLPGVHYCAFNKEWYDKNIKHDTKMHEWLADVAEVYVYEIDVIKSITDGEQAIFTPEDIIEKRRV